MMDDLESLVQNLISSKSESEATEFLDELHRLFPNSRFGFHPAAGLIMWWPHHSLIRQPIPHFLNYIASTIYNYDQDVCHIVKDRNGMNFATPKEVNILQALLS